MGDSNFWFYTLSAIPQTLAAMIALAATFAVVKLDSLSKKIAEIRGDLKRFILLLTSPLEIDEKEIHTIEPISDKHFLDVFEQGFFRLDDKKPNMGLGEDLFKKYQNELFNRVISSEWRSYYSAKDSRVYGYLKMKRDIFKGLIEKKKKIVYLMVLGLIQVGFVISISLSMLPFYSYYYNWNKLLVVLSMVVGAVLSVVVTGLIVWKIAKIEEVSEPI